MASFENIVIGYSLVSVDELISSSLDEYVGDDNLSGDISKTYFTDDRNLARVLKAAGVVPSISEVRRNKPEFLKTFDNYYTDCFWVKWGKKRIYVVVGQVDKKGIKDLYLEDWE